PTRPLLHRAPEHVPGPERNRPDGLGPLRATEGFGGCSSLARPASSGRRPGQDRAKDLTTGPSDSARGLRGRQVEVGTCDPSDELWKIAEAAVEARWDRHRHEP